MKKSFLILLLFLLCIQGFSQKYFEGIVEYDITYESINPAITEKALAEVFGTKLKLYYKEGTYMREYLGEDGKAIRKYIYLATDNRLYFVEMTDLDTIAYVDAGEKPFEKYKIEKGPADTILGCACPSRVISYKYYESLFEDSINAREEYFFCHKLPVNPDYFKKYYVWYDVIKEEKSIALKFTEKREGYFKIIYTAYKIDQAKISEKIFEIDKNAVLMHRSKAQ